MEKILEILRGLHDDVDYDNEKALIDGGIFDSFDIIQLVGELNDAFDIEINVEDLTSDNFNSAKAIYDLVQELKQ